MISLKNVCVESYSMLRPVFFPHNVLTVAKKHRVTSSSYILFFGIPPSGHP